MNRVVYLVLPFVGGALLAVQAPMNARLRSVVGSPLAAGLASFILGATFLLALTAAAGDLGAVSAAGRGPWWAYLGGVCGAVLVVATLLATPRVGVLATFVSVVAGELAFAVAIDRFGWFGSPRIPITWDRAVALALLVIALVLIVRSSRA